MGEKGLQWPSMSLGLTLGCALYDPCNEDGRNLTGAARALRLLVSELAHLIWKMRCERRIANSDDVDHWPSENEIVGRLAIHDELEAYP